MSRISDRLQSHDAVDFIWKFCLYLTLVIVIVTISMCVKIIQHLHCISKSAYSSDTQFNIQLKHVKTYSTFSVTFATLSVIVSFSKYLVCTQWSCVYTALNSIYAIIWWDFYILSKIFLYLIFIGRLFNPHYQRIYQYSKFIQYILWMMLSVLILIGLEFNVIAVLLMCGITHPYALDTICTIMYAMCDITISSVTMILFFRPLCRGSILNSNDADVSVIKKYGILSALQLVAAISFQISFMGSIYMSAIDAPVRNWAIYNYTIRTIQILDSLLLMICIHFGFARKQTVCIVIISEYILA